MRRALACGGIALLLGAGLAAPGAAKPRTPLPNLFAYPLDFLVGPITGHLEDYDPSRPNPRVIDGCLPEERLAGASRCLRFRTRLTNLDLPHLELVLRTEASGTNVYQVVPADGGVRYRRAGTFTVDAIRGEVQLDGFYVVRLWTFDGTRRVGPPVASTGRRGLCPGFSRLSPFQPRCAGEARLGRAGPEGVVVLPWLWHNFYKPSLPGQYIDISGVPDGTYVLEIEIDPADRIAESYERDNATCVVVRLEGDEATALRHDYCWPKRT